MKELIIIAIVLSVALSLRASANETDLSNIFVIQDFVPKRESTTDPVFEGNDDFRPIPVGESLVLADIDGPGKIVHIWCTIQPGESWYGKYLVLRMYWDGEKEPSVEVPINDFFCQGHGIDMNVDSMPFKVSAEGRARNCYLPMPFHKSAKVTVTNEGHKDVKRFYCAIDWQQVKSLPENTGYFHASYRQEFPCTEGKHYEICDIEGKGQFIGCNLSVKQNEDGWWGEGDDMFYIDGEEKPSLMGTGAEDYFCDAWRIRKQDGLYYGMPMSEGWDTGAKHVCYRFHIPDPVPFTKSLRLEIEHWGHRDSEDGKRVYCVERPDH